MGVDHIGQVSLHCALHHIFGQSYCSPKFNDSPEYVGRPLIDHISNEVFNVLYYLKHEQQCFVRYKDTKPSIFRSDKTRTANVLNCFKNNRSSKFIGEVIFKICVVQVEKIKGKVYVNQGKSLSHIKIRHAYDFSLCFPHELLMCF